MAIKALLPNGTHISILIAQHIWNSIQLKLINEPIATQKKKTIC